MFIPGGGEILSSEGTTQGDPLGMAMYALAIKPLINELHNSCDKANQVWFADDASAAAKCQHLRKWWDLLSTRGPKYGYCPNGKKSFLIVKECYLDEATRLFEGTGITITTIGARHLGAALGSSQFKEEYVKLKVSQWCDEIERLASIASSQPHAAFAAYIHGQQHKWSFIQRTIRDIEELFRPLEDCIKKKLIPAITGRAQCSNVQRDLLSLPPRIGGLGLSYPTDSDAQFQSSVKITSPLTEMIVNQAIHAPLSSSDSTQLKAEVKKLKKAQDDGKVASLRQQLSKSQQRLLECAEEKGASNWVTSIPLEEFDFLLHKGDFRDALCLRYGWQVNNLPTHCACGESMSVDHALCCHKGGYTICRHNKVRDLTEVLLREVCPNTSIEPPLQPLSGESFDHGTSSREDEARLDIKASGFWRAGQEALFDVRVFYPNAPTYKSKPLSSVYRQHEMDKKRRYGERVREVERAAFTPLVFACTGGMARECTTFFKRLSSMIAERRKMRYQHVINWLRCQISFLLLRQSIMAIRGSRSGKKTINIPADFACV